MIEPAKYPHIIVRLIGKDGNAFNVLGLCMRQMRAHGLTDDAVEEFRKEATSGDYDRLLATAARWFEIR